METAWLPRGTRLSSGNAVGKLICYGKDWQLYRTSGETISLAVSKELMEYWVQNHLLESGIFEEIGIACVFDGKNEYIVSSASQGPYSCTEMDAIAFAIALCETRKIFGGNLKDGLYIEELSRVFPTHFEDKDGLSDEVVIGCWITHGVEISICNKTRILQLAPWITDGGYEKILISSGLHKTRIESNKKDDAGKRDKPEFRLAGRPKLENFFREQILDVVEHLDRYQRMGITFPGATVLYGAPGCGKTYAVEQLVKYLDWPCYHVTSGSIGSPYIHDTSKKISEVFDTAIENAPSVIVIDEMEAFLTTRGSGQFSGGHHTEEVAEFLRRIPEASEKKVLIFGMTNLIDTIDPAILRRGRFDHLIEVGMPSKEEILSLLQSLYSKLPISPDVSLDRLAEILEGHPISDVAFLVKESGRLAAKNALDEINPDCINQAVSLIAPEKKQKRKIGFD